MKKLDRRTLLRGAGGVAIGLPFLEIMGTGGPLGLKAAGASAGTFPKRFLVFFQPNGIVHETWRPLGDENDFILDDPNQPGRALAPLEAYKQDLLILDGIDQASRSHGPGINPHDLGMGHMLTAQPLELGPSGVGQFEHLPDGSAGGISIDQEVANHIGTDTKFRSFEFGTRGSTRGHCRHR
jgi:hypothetical protein